MLRIGRIPPRLILNFRRGILRERMKIQDYIDAIQISMLYITALVGGFLVLLNSHGKPHVYKTSDITSGLQDGTR